KARGPLARHSGESRTAEAGLPERTSRSDCRRPYGAIAALNSSTLHQARHSGESPNPVPSLRARHSSASWNPAPRARWDHMALPRGAEIMSKELDSGFRRNDKRGERGDGVQ